MSNKIIKIIGYVLFAVSIIIAGIFFFSDAKDLNKRLAEIENEEQQTKILEVEKLADEWPALILNFAIYLLIAAALLAVGFAIYKFVVNIIDEPKSAVKPLLIILVLAAIFIASYSLASGTLVGLESIKNITVTESISKWVETSLYGMYFFFGITILALVYAEISKALK